MALTYVGMEHFGSFAEEPLEQCRAKVRAANIVVLVLADRYGSAPPDSEVSFTEHEYREALNSKTAVLAYLKSLASGDANEDRKLVNLKAEIRRSLGVSEFMTPEGLAWQVACDLHRQVTSARSTADSLSGQQLRDLVALFELRARALEAELSKHYRYASIDEFLNRFRPLHARHLDYLRQENLVLAHEVLGQIHALTYRLQADEFWRRHNAETPSMRYMLKPTEFMDGPASRLYARGYYEAGVNRLEAMAFGLPPMGPESLPACQSARDNYSMILRMESDA
jgi:hypothetical protein